jgi:hypothetical protein
MDYFQKVAIFAILYVIFTEVMSCVFGGWCYGDVRREGKNLEMFSIYFVAGACAFMVGNKLTM